MGVMQDSRLFEAPPVPEGAILRPLDCRGKGRHDKLGYRCANYPLEGCLGWVCKRCANKQSPKPFTETCNMCQLAEMHGSSMPKALVILGELHPESVKSGKAGCAATIKGAEECARCLRKFAGTSIATRGRAAKRPFLPIVAARRIVPIFAAPPPFASRKGHRKNGLGHRQPNFARPGEN